MPRVTKNELERVFFFLLGIIKISLYKPTFHQSPFGPKKSSLAEQVEV